LRDECHGSRSLTLPLTGLDCAQCARRIEGALERLSPVDRVFVDLAREQVTICLRTGADPDLNAIDAAITRCGYDLRRARVHIPIVSLSFGPAPQWIERRMLSVPGVVSAVANPASGMATVDYLVGTATIDSIREAISASGYDAGHAAATGMPASEAQPRYGARVVGSIAAALGVTILAAPLATIDSPGIPDFAARALRTYTSAWIPQLHTVNPAALELGILAGTVLLVILLGREWVTGGLGAMRRGFTDQNTLRALAVLISLIAGAVSTAIFVTAGRTSPHAFVAYATTAWILAFFSIVAWLESRVGAEMTAAAGTIQGHPWRARSADPAARLIAIVSAMAAVTAFVLWFVFAPEQRWVMAISSAVAIFAAALPSLGPVAATRAMARALREINGRGITFRSVATIERLGKLSRIVLDQRGVVTQGKPFRSGYVLLEGLEQRELLRLAGALAERSKSPAFDALRHPSSASVVTEEESAGGIAGKVDGVRVALGNPEWIEARGVSTYELQEEIGRFTATGESPLIVAIDGKARGAITVGDKLIETVQHAAARLEGAGLKVTLLSPEPEASATAIASQAGIGEIARGVSPAERSGVITRMRRNGEAVGLITSGSAGAAAADLNISVGPDSPESADVRVSGGLENLSAAIEVARAASIRFDRIATTWHVVAIPLAAQVLYPLVGKLISPVILAAGAAAAAGAALRRGGEPREHQP
jgi:P-type E1-E2 ATPase